MNSSTSSSSRAWARYAVTLAGGALALAALLFAAVVVIDPYDSGRFPSWGDGAGTPRFGQRLADASRGRNPAYDSAIVGNSTVQLLDPARLSARTGGKFVSLAIPGTGPYEELVVLGWFLRHHPDARFVVLGLDYRWCDLPRVFGPSGVTYPFPFWLYGDSRWEYLQHLFSYKSAEAAGQRVAFLLGRVPAARPDGYSDYEAGKTYDPSAARARILPTGPDNDLAAEDSTPASPPSLELVLPPFARLAAIQQKLPSGTRLVLVFPPRVAERLPAPGSDAAEAVAACKEAAHALAAHPNTSMVDFLTDGPIARDDTNFWDDEHYRFPIARQIEDAIAAAK